MKIFISILILISLHSCDKEHNNFIYSEYQLPRNCTLNIEDDKAFVINDEVGFQQIFSDYPNLKPVNFNKYTLVLLKGTSPYGFSEIEKVISKNNENKYEFKMTIMMNILTALSPWHLAYIIPKTDAMDIMFTVNYVHL